MYVGARSRTHVNSSFSEEFEVKVNVNKATINVIDLLELTQEKRRRLLNSYFLSQFKYCPIAVSRQKLK